MSRQNLNPEDLAWAAVNAFIVSGGTLATTLPSTSDERTVVSAVLGAFFFTAGARLGIPMGYRRYQDRQAVYEE